MSSSATLYLSDAEVHRRTETSTVTAPALLTGEGVYEAPQLRDPAQPEPLARLLRHWFFDALLQMPPGWDGSIAAPISNVAVDLAVRLLVPLLELRASMPAIVPTVDGGIALEWARDGSEFTFTCTPEAICEVAYVRADTGESLDVELSAAPECVFSAFASIAQTRPAVVGGHM